MDQAKQVILSDSRRVSLRPPRLIDLVMSWTDQQGGLTVLRLVCRIGSVGGKPLRFEDLESMRCDDLQMILATVEQFKKRMENLVSLMAPYGTKK